MNEFKKRKEKVWNFSFLFLKKNDIRHIFCKVNKS